MQLQFGLHFSNLIVTILKEPFKLVASIRNLSYEKRLEALGLTTLMKRRQRGDLIQTHKIMHNIDKLKKVNRFSNH